MQYLKKSAQEQGDGNPGIEKRVIGCHFDSDDDVMAAVDRSLQVQDSFKCINVGGDSLKNK